MRRRPRLIECLLEAEKWLKAAFDGGAVIAQQHLAHLALDAGLEDTALALLKKHLSWRVQTAILQKHLSCRLQTERNTCAGCGQTRGEEAPMLTCSGCRVARFCSEDHKRLLRKKQHWAGVC